MMMVGSILKLKFGIGFYISIITLKVCFII
jgi:hypothetical protein